MVSGFQSLAEQYGSLEMLFKRSSPLREHLIGALLAGAIMAPVWTVLWWWLP
jgi:hypothetical protein